MSEVRPDELVDASWCSYVFSMVLASIRECSTAFSVIICAHPESRICSQTMRPISRLVYSALYSMNNSRCSCHGAFAGPVICVR